MKAVSGAAVAGADRSGWRRPLFTLFTQLMWLLL